MHQEKVKCLQSSLMSFYEASKEYPIERIDGKPYITDKYGVKHLAYSVMNTDRLYIEGEIQCANGVVATRVIFQPVEQP